MDNKQIIPTALGMSYEEIEKLNDVRPYDFETEREKKWYEIGLIDGAEAADIKNNDILNEKLNLEDKVKRQAEYIKKVCAESSTDIQKLDAENKQLKEELSDKGNHIEVLLGRIEKLELDKHSLDQVAKVFQSNLGKKDTEINELHKRILLLEAELREVD